MKRSASTGSSFWALGLLALLVLAWELAVDRWGIPSYILPPPARIPRALVETAPLLWEHTRATLLESFLGFTASIALGVVVALGMDRVVAVKKTLYPLVVISQTIPIIFLAPLLLTWFGFGILPKVIVVGLVCFFPVAIGLYDGLTSADQEVIDLLKTMGASPWQVMRIVKIPGALPSFFSGLRISATYSVMAAVIGEWLGASKGLGVFMIRASHSFLVDRVFAAILVVSVLSLLVFGGVNLLQRLLMPWYYLQQGESPAPGWFKLQSLRNNGKRG